MYDDQLIIYYSDQRLNATYGQRLVHQTSTDLRTWGPVVPDVEYPTYTDRPGMTTVTRLPTGDYMMTYEYGHYTNATAGTYLFPVYYRISADPRRFSEAASQPLVAADTGTVPTGSPYVVWSPAGGGGNGTVVVSSGGLGSVFTNTRLGDPDAWAERQTGAPVSYTRHLRVLGRDRLLIMGAGVLPPSTSNNVSLSILGIEDLVSA